MIKAGWDVVITHGNGPQVGFILLRSELASHVLHTVPLDSCGADTQGALGYMIQQCLYNEFLRQNVPKQAATVVTQVVVDRNDPAFLTPASRSARSTRGEGAPLPARASLGDARRCRAGLAARCALAAPAGDRGTSSHSPHCVGHGYAVIAVGGGGVPVVRDEDGTLHGVEAVIDKDYASALLASAVHADLFLISTAVDRVAINFRKPDQRFLDRMTVAEAKRHLADGQFPAGSMGPKIEACLQFLQQGGKQAIITSPERIADALRGQSGTLIVPLTPPSPERC